LEEKLLGRAEGSFVFVCDGSGVVLERKLRLFGFSVSHELKYFMEC
jgi:hypothetical protein